MLFDRIKESVKDAQEYADNIAKCYNENRQEIIPVAKAFNRIEDKIIRISIDSQEINLHISGDRHVLNAIFGIFRKLGYEPSSRPKDKNLTSFTCHFSHHDHDCKFYLNFTSTNCKRIKVRTETQEVDIYETVCE